MSDIVEIALDRFTDYTLFERLACEIMREEGYPAIRPLGGTKDGGKDAEERPLYVAEGSRQRTIFQISMEENALRKVRKTVRRLNQQKELYGTLVYVTTRSIPTASQDEIRKAIRKEFDVPVDIVSRETLVNRLADFNNGIFHRFFPDIDAQLRDFRTRRRDGVGGLSRDREAALLRMSLMLTLGEQTSNVQQSTLDRLVLAILLDAHPSVLSEDDIKQKIPEFTRTCDIEGAELKSALARLTAAGLAVLEDGTTRAAEIAIDAEISNDIRMETRLEALVSDIVDMLSLNSGSEVPDAEMDHLRRNCRDLLVDYLRLFGHELANLTFGDQEQRLVYAEALPEIQQKAKRQVSPQNGDLLISCLAEVLAKPNPDQAKWISGLSLAYLGAAVLGLDPALRELTGDKLANKTFFLDTDIAIACLVEEDPVSFAYSSVIRRLAQAGAKIIIPESCVRECAEHAGYSPKTYNHFGTRLLALPETTVAEQVWNGFVKGYYYGRTYGKLPDGMSYKKYLRNYYDSRDPFGFMREALQNVFPHEVTFQNLDDLIAFDTIPQDKRCELERHIFDHLMTRAKKAEYRTEEQTWALAKTDAALFLGVYYLNANLAAGSGRILSGTHYLITGSGRYVTCARSAGLDGKVTTRLQSVAGILRTLGRIDMTPTEFMHLLENPFLVYAVNQSRDDIEGLVKAGVRLAGVSLPRLRRDLDAGMHERITVMERVCQAPFVAEEPSTLGDEQYLAVLEEAERKGYGLVDSAQDLKQRLEAAKKDYETRMAVIDEYAKTVETFARRKQRFLKRMEGRAKRNR